MQHYLYVKVCGAVLLYLRNQNVCMYLQTHVVDWEEAYFLSKNVEKNNFRVYCKLKKLYNLQLVVTFKIGKIEFNIENSESLLKVFTSFF